MRRILIFTLDGLLIEPRHTRDAGTFYFFDPGNTF